MTIYGTRLLRGAAALAVLTWLLGVEAVAQQAGDAPPAAAPASPPPPVVMLPKCEVCQAFPPRPSSQLDLWWADAQKNPAFAPRVDALRVAHHRSLIWLYAGGAATLVGLATSFIVSVQCPMAYRGEQCPTWTVPFSFILSGAFAAATTIGYLVIRPSEVDLAEVLNDWNLLHRARPVEPRGF